MELGEGRAGPTDDVMSLPRASMNGWSPIGGNVTGGPRERLEVLVAMCWVLYFLISPAFEDPDASKRHRSERPRDVPSSSGSDLEECADGGSTVASYLTRMSSEHEILQLCVQVSTC